MKTRLHFGINLWMKTDKGVLLGPGRMRLLELVGETGSLRKAAEVMGMSYRAAWGKIKESEDALGAPLLGKRGSNRQGSHLSADGQELIRLYKDWLEEVKRHAAATAQTTFKEFFDLERP
ncbi:MAG: LysR family transcriptional regulator [Desulfovibrio sp.]|nr:LysR family transcriptional regulator [Desulfovibrio sp.]